MKNVLHYTLKYINTRFFLKKTEKYILVGLKLTMLRLQFEYVNYRAKVLHARFMMV